MQLTTFTILSADGVMQGLGGPDEDPSGGFERGGWALPLFDDDEMALVNEVYQRADAFLFGRRTYEIFAGSWGAVVEPDTNTIAAALSTKPKYVASTTLTEPRWANTTVLSDDIGAAIGELRAEREGEFTCPDRVRTRATPSPPEETSSRFPWSAVGSRPTRAWRNWQTRWV